MCGGFECVNTATVYDFEVSIESNVFEIFLKQKLVSGPWSWDSIRYFRLAFGCVVCLKFSVWNSEITKCLRAGMPNWFSFKKHNVKLTCSVNLACQLYGYFDHLNFVVIKFQVWCWNYPSMSCQILHSIVQIQNRAQTKAAILLRKTIVELFLLYKYITRSIAENS